MRIVGYIDPPTGATNVANLSADGASLTPIATLDEFWADPFGALPERTGAGAVPSASVRLVPPVLPGARVICIGLNYLKHVEEGSYRGEGVPEHPTLFARWTQSLTVDGAQVPVPANEDGLDWEGEIVAWVGVPLVDADPDQALAAVLGYSTFNDITARRAQKLTTQWILGKNGDSSGPLGPLVPAAEVGDLRDGLRVQTRVNGQTVQDGNTDQMVYTVGDTLPWSPEPSPSDPATCWPLELPPGSAMPARPHGCCTPATSSRSRLIVSASCATPSSTTSTVTPLKQGSDSGNTGLPSRSVAPSSGNGGEIAVLHGGFPSSGDHGLRAPQRVIFGSEVGQLSGWCGGVPNDQSGGQFHRATGDVVTGDHADDDPDRGATDFLDRLMDRDTGDQPADQADHDQREHSDLTVR